MLLFLIKQCLHVLQVFPFQAGHDEGCHGFRVIVSHKFMNIVIIISHTVVLTSQSGYGTNLGNADHSVVVYLDKMFQNAFVAFFCHFQVRLVNVPF